MVTTWKKVPRAVLELLAESRWEDDDKVFESVFWKRRLDPSWYIYRREEGEPSWGSAFSGAEAWELHRQGAFGPHAVAREDGCSVNEHAAHALAACLAEMSVAWDKYQERLRQIPKV